MPGTPFLASWVCSPAGSPDPCPSWLSRRSVRGLEQGADQVERALQREVQQTRGAGLAAPLHDSLPHLPFSLKQSSPTSMMKFKMNITVQLSGPPRVQPRCIRMAEETAPSAWRAWERCLAPRQGRPTPSLGSVPSGSPAGSSDGSTHTYCRA